MLRAGRGPPTTPSVRPGPAPLGWAGLLQRMGTGPAAVSVGGGDVSPRSRPAGPGKDGTGSARTPRPMWAQGGPGVAAQAVPQRSLMCVRRWAGAPRPAGSREMPGEGTGSHLVALCARESLLCVVFQSLVSGRRWELFVLSGNAGVHVGDKCSGSFPTGLSQGCGGSRRLGWMLWMLWSCQQLSRLKNNNTAVLLHLPHGCIRAARHSDEVWRLNH